MRNLKKFLALVLAMMMVLGLMITANASTGFADDDEISDKYREAADVLSTIGVYEGENGNFNPKGDIRRAEFSILLYRMATGDVAGKWAALGAQVDQFTDVITGDNINFGWAAPYVNYAASMTWFEGDTGVGGTFRPGDPVSYHEVLICMLRVLGLADDITDPNTWRFEAADRATRLGLVEGIDSLAGNATREEVAQLILNTLVYTTESGYIWTVYIDDGRYDASPGGIGAANNGKYDPGADTLLYQGPDYDRAMLHAQSTGAIVEDRKNTAGSLADDNFNGLSRIEDTDQYRRHTIVWIDNDHTDEDPIAEFAVTPDFYYNGDFTVADQEALVKAVGDSNIYVYYNGVSAKSNPNYWQSANFTNNTPGLWYGNNKSTSLGLPGMEVYVYKNSDKTYDVVIREAVVAQISSAANTKGELKLKVYESTPSDLANVTAGDVEYTVDGDDGSRLHYYANEVYAPLANSKVNTVVAVYMTPGYASNNSNPEDILGVEVLEAKSVTISHIRDNGMNINSTLQTSSATYDVASKALWRKDADGTDAFVKVLKPGFNNSRSGRNIDVGSATLYVLTDDYGNETVLFIDQTKGVTVSNTTYAYLWDTKDVVDTGWKTEQDAAMQYGRLYLDDSKTFIEALVTYVNPNTGNEYTSAQLTQATQGAFNVDEGGILVTYTKVAATSTVPEHYKLSLADPKTAKTGTNRASCSIASGAELAVKTNVAQGHIVDSSTGSIVDAVFDNATIFYVVNTVPEDAGDASKYEVVNVFHGVREIPTGLYITSDTEFQVVFDTTKGITNLVRSVVIKNPGDGTVSSMSGIYFIVGDQTDDPKNSNVTYHTVRLSSSLTVNYYEYKAVIGNTGEVTSVYVNQKIDGTNGNLFTLIGQDVSNMTYDKTLAAYGYMVLDTSAGSAVWDYNDASPDSATNGSVDSDIFTKFDNLVIRDAANDVISLDGTQGKSYIMTDIPIYQYDTVNGGLTKIDFADLDNGMTGYAVLTKNASGRLDGGIAALYVTTATST